MQTSAEALQLLINQVAKAMVPQVSALPAVAPSSPFPMVVVDGKQIDVYNEYPQLPRRIAQVITLHDSDSFVGYVKRHREETSVIFFNDKDGAFTAVLDFHGPTVPALLPAPTENIEKPDGDGSLFTSIKIEAEPAFSNVSPQQPHWCDHRAIFKLIKSTEWTEWEANNEKKFSQLEFAEFLEENLIDVVEPDGAMLFEIARSLEAKKDVNFNSAVRLNNSTVSFGYDETLTGTANTTQGKIDIPTEIKLQMPLYQGGPVYRFPARFKWKLANRQLSIWYEIVRKERLIEQALKEIVASLKGNISEVPMFVGVPGQLK